MNEISLLIAELKKHGNITIDIYSQQIVARRSQDRSGVSGDTLEEALRNLLILLEG